MTYRPPAETLVACVWLPYFELQVEGQRYPELAGAPVALITPAQRPVVTACSPEAREQGIRPGMLLREVTATAPRTVCRVADPSFYADHFARVLARLETLSPVIEPCGLGTVYLGMEGLLPGIYPEPDALVEALEQAVPPPYRFQAGVGRGKFIALAAAHAEGPTPGATLSPSGRTCWVADRHRKAFLASLPVELLPVSVEMQQRLRRLGLRTLASVAALPRSALLAQFGPEGERAWQLSRGKDEEPLHPPEVVEEVQETLQFPAPEASFEALLLAVRQLLERALRRAELRGRGVRQVRLEAELENLGVWTQITTFRNPGTQAESLFPPLKYHLERDHPADAVESLTLAFAAMTRTLSGQLTLFSRPEQERRDRLEEELRQLRTRMGQQPVYRILEVEPWSRIPERRYGLISSDL